MTAWDITIAFDRRDLSQPLFRQLARFIALEITRGRLSPGSRLPGTRALARQLAVSRQTVAAAYESLISEGWLRAVPASGTFVTTQIPHFTFSTGDPVTGQRPNAVITATPQRRAPRHTLDLSSGQPDLRALPTDELSRAFRRALRLGSRDVLGYADPAATSASGKPWRTCYPRPVVCQQASTT